LIAEGKGRAIGVMDPRGAGAALSSFSQEIAFTSNKEVGNSISMEHQRNKRQRKVEN
jgi:hypothetical protein